MPGMPKLNSAPTIHIVDDDESFRTGIKRLLEAMGYQVRIYRSGREFLRHTIPPSPGCILLDLYLPDLSGLDVQRELVKRGEVLPIVFISGQATVPVSVRAMQAGANDFLTKPVQKNALLSAIASALARDAERGLEREKLRSIRELYEKLTPRQRAVLQGVVSGKLNKQIAAELGVAERTIKAHRAEVMRKMHVDSVAALVQITVQLNARRT